MRMNINGFSLIGALVSVAIVSVIALTVFNLVGLAGDILSTFNNSIRAMDTAQEVRFALSEPKTCSLNFANLNILHSSKDKPVRLDRDLRYPGTGGMALTDKPIVSIDPDGEPLELEGIYIFRAPSPNLAYVQVRLRHSIRERSSPASLGTLMRSMPIWVRLDPSGVITCCTTLNMLGCP